VVLTLRRDSKECRGGVLAARVAATGVVGSLDERGARSEYRLSDLVAAESKKASKTLAAALIARVASGLFWHLDTLEERFRVSMMPAMSSGLIIDCRRESRSPWPSSTREPCRSRVLAGVSGPGWVNTKDARNSWARAKT